MSLADCFAAALALQQAAVYTGDPKFKAVVHEVKLIWMRPGEPNVACRPY